MTIGLTRVSNERFSSTKPRRTERLGGAWRDSGELVHDCCNLPLRTWTSNRTGFYLTDRKWSPLRDKSRRFCRSAIETHACDSWRIVVVTPPKSRSSLLPSPSWPQQLAFGGLLVLLCGAAVLLVEGADVASRAAGLRLWALAGAGLFAVAPPNVLLPDPNAPLLQLLNWPPRRLLRYQTGRLVPLVILVALPAVLLAYADPAAPFRHLGTKTTALGQALLLVLGTAADSFVHFATLGPRSQAWQEGRAGQWYQDAVEERGQGVSLPRGLVPALFATTRCFIIGLAAVLLTAAGAQMGPPGSGWVPGMLVLGWAGHRLWQERAVYDRHFYHTTAFYDEVMGGGTLHATGRDPLPYDALYWVLPRWRPATWAGLRQLDRRLPLGRLVALAHGGLWLLCLRGVSATVVAGYLGVVFTAQVATCGLLTTDAAAPLSFQRTLQSTLDWVGTRTFVNLRWLGAHAASLGLVALFGDTYGPDWVLTWIAAHATLALAAAAVITFVHEGRAHWASA